MQIVKVTSISTLLILAGCAFDSDNGRFAFDLNSPQEQTAQTEQSARSATIEGIYRSENITDSTRYEQMVIKNVGQARYQISISSSETQNGCQFETVGQLSGRHIRIPLSLFNPRLNSAMMIKFTGGRASVDTVHPKHYNDLKQFCQGGGSLVGHYEKIR